jgi:hypothetical protein
VEDKKKNLAAAAVHADDCEQREEVKVVELDGHDEESAGAKLGDKKEAAKAVKFILNKRTF